jgi:transglutaminase-like putative cysteine protease
MPLWISGWCIAFWTYAFLVYLRKLPQPGRIARLFYTITGCTLILVFLGGIRLDSQAFIGLLCVMAGLKPLETVRHRDRVVTLFMAYFIIIISLISIENLVITLYMFISVLATTTCLVHVNHPGRQLRVNLRLVGVIMLQAIPLMVLCFILFPRLEGSIFSLPSRFAGQTGFTDTLRPGSISQLVQVDQTAFRVQFDQKIPEAADLYWRGLVLWNFDGKHWTRGKMPRHNRRFVRSENYIEYDIILEPHRKKHLFALDVPITAPRFTALTEDFTLRARWPVRTVQRYRVRSARDVQAHIGAAQERMARQLPDEGNPQSRILAASWSSNLDSPEAILKAAIRFFSQGDFVYTLRPGLLGENPVDGFLFNSRSGYCEHYASAFTFLMRAAGIPARVVVGFQGGDLNPYGNYLIVKQYHAHAWVEVFLTDQGWIRVDPTALVAPERVSVGITGSLASDDLPDFLDQTSIRWLRGYIQRLVYMADAINLRWNAWFMEYSRTEQAGLMRKIIADIRRPPSAWITAMFILVAVLAAWAGIRYRYRMRSKRKDQVQETYNLFCRKLKQIGIQRHPAQGPLDWAQLINMHRPKLKKDVAVITDAYITLRYKPNSGDMSLRKFKGLVGRFDT